MQKTNKQAVLELLDISKVDSIYDVIGRMELLINYCEYKENLRSILPFLKTYYFVTKSVANKNLEKKYAYKDFHELEKIDIVFASLFFRPLEAYIKSGKKIQPWASYFNYIEKNSAFPFLKMLQGINTHINADLPVVLDIVHAKQLSDFEFINQILLEVIPDVMKNLAYYEHDILGLGSLFLEGFVVEEFKQIIVKWRSIAWQNYQRINQYTRKDLAYRRLHQNSQLVAEELERIFTARNIADLPRFFHQLNNLENIILLS